MLTTAFQRTLTVTVVCPLLCSFSFFVSTRGVRNEQLSSLIDIEDCIFTHANGFIGGNKTHAGVLQMARKSIQS